MANDFDRLRKNYELYQEFEELNRSVQELESFIVPVIEARHPISIRIDIEKPEEEHKEHPDVADRHAGFLEFLRQKQHLHFERRSSDDRTEPLNIHETVAVLTALLRVRRDRRDALRKELESLITTFQL